MSEIQRYSFDTVEGWAENPNGDICLFTDHEAAIALKDGTIAADDERLIKAAEKAGIAYMGCDTADWLAETVVELRAELAACRERADIAESSPIHIGFAHNDDEGVLALYILDEENEEIDREVKADCLLRYIKRRYEKIKNENASLTTELGRARGALEKIAGMEFPLEISGAQLADAMSDIAQAALKEAE